MMNRRRFLMLGVASVSTLAGLSVLTPTVTLADTPTTNTYFICPATSLQNDHGMWVMGQHGAYYVLIPTQGNSGSKVYLTVPVQVASLAQIPAGWALYNSLPSYPNFVGTVGLLAEGIATWLGSPAGWSEGDMAMVVSNGDGTYAVTDVTIGKTITINHPIPLASAALW
jgi:hypothetical protein